MKSKTSLSRRHFVISSLASGVMTSLPARSLWAANLNNSLNIGFISCGGRAGQLAKQFADVEGVNIAGLCDPDQRRIEIMSHKYPKAEKWHDLRDMLKSKNIDAVVVATCNHWHCLAAIWAMEAGKDVYVEKPLSHSQWEGTQTIAAARRYDKICQIGTQQRSDPMQAQIKKFLHEEKALGAIQSARVNRFGIRPSIGKRDTPLPIDKDVSYDLWLGPAQDEPIFRKKLHYDWHWDWNTGSGEMGNWGVHVLDDVRNNVFQDRISIPKRILGGGGRVALDDAGETPNVHFVYFDTGDIPVVIGLNNLPGNPGSQEPTSHPGPSSGYIVYCEGGRFEGQRGRGTAFDNDGKVIKTFKGNSGDGIHQHNFVEAVLKRDSSLLNAEVEVGHHSTGWCNLANIAQRAGSEFTYDQANEIGLKEWKDLLQEMDTSLTTHGLKMATDSIKLSPVLELDVEEEKFIGDHADIANKYLKREYRQGYEVPELAQQVSS